MEYRKYGLTILLAFLIIAAKGQQLTFQKVDSASYSQFLTGDWQQLISFGNKAVAADIDFPKLRLRMGYAYFSMGNYSGALGQYQKVTNNDTHNDTARYFSYLCNKYLNRDANAFYHAGYLDTITLKNEKLSPFGLVQAGIESGVKTAGDSYRGDASYSHVSLSNRLGWRLVLDQSLAYFSQPVTIKETSDRETSTTEKSTDIQKEYYGKANVVVLDNLLLIAAYHYFNTSYLQTTYNNNAGFASLKYVGPYFDLQAGVDFSHISGDNYMQYDSKLSIYPLGNFNLYTTTGFTMAQATNRNYIFTELAGIKAAKNLWMEASVTLGKLDNYFEYDALYVYNAIDMTTFKAGATLYYQLGRHALLYLNYTSEKKADAIESINYNQSSITGGLTWKF